MSAPLAAPRWAFTAIACALSSVTAVSVALAMHALIDDPILALLFAGAAVLLDIYKYLAWPLALTSLLGRRFVAAALLALTALALAGVSGWATYDRLMHSIVGSRAEHEAIQVQRIADLEHARTIDQQLIASLAAEADSTRAQAESMRARGMVTRALELETSALPRISDQRDQARQRLDAASLELTQLRASTPKGAGLPLELATLLCIGFALALEIVPALLLSVVRGSFSAPTAPVVAEATIEAVSDNAQGALETQETAVETEISTAETPEPAVSESPAVQAENAELLQKLLTLASETPAGERVKLKEFAKTHRIGNLRAASIFSVAAEIGALQKTTTGYLAA
jgi:hypothetical protein